MPHHQPTRERGESQRLPRVTTSDLPLYLAHSFPSRGCIEALRQLLCILAKGKGETREASFFSLQKPLPFAFRSSIPIAWTIRAKAPDMSFTIPCAIFTSTIVGRLGFVHDIGSGSFGMRVVSIWISDVDIDGLTHRR